MKADKSNSAPTIHQWASIQNIYSSHFRTSSLNGVWKELKPSKAMRKREVEADVESAESEVAMALDVSREISRFPTYETLFAEGEATGWVERDSSILSPAAYFVDLMRLIETTVKNTPSGLGLDDRRPDLREIELDAKNTTTEVPYLEIVNEVIATTLRGLNSNDEDHDPLQRLTTSIYPFDNPYNAHLDRIRTYLKHFKIDLATIYELFDAVPVDIARETLGLSREEHDLLTTPDSSEKGLRKAYGFPDKRELDLDNVPVFLAHSGLTRDQLTDLVEQGLSQSDLVVRWEPPSPRKLLFINRDPVVAGLLTIGRTYRDPTHFVEVITDFGSRAADLLHRFIRLANKLEWSFADLDWALVSIGADEINDDAILALTKIKKLKDKLELPIDELTCFWHDMKRYGGGDRAIPQDLFTRTFNDPHEFFQFDQWNGDLRSPDRPESEFIWNVDDRESASNVAIRAHMCGALKVSDTDLDAMVSHLRAGATQADGNKVELTLRFVTRLYRIRKLATVLGLCIHETLLLFRLLNKDEIKSIDELIEVTEYSDLLEDQGVSIDQLNYITSGVSHGYDDIGHINKDVKTLLAEVLQAAGSWRVKATDFKNDRFDEADAQILFSALQNTECMDKRAVVHELPEVLALGFSISRLMQEQLFEVYSLLRPFVETISTRIKLTTDTFSPLVNIDDNTDLSFLFPEEMDQEQQSLIVQIRSALMRLQRLSPFLREDSFVADGIDEEMSRRIIDTLYELGITDHNPNSGWRICKVIGEDDDLPSCLPYLEESQIKSVREVLRNSSANFVCNSLLLRQELQVQGVIEKLAGLFGVAPTLMREVLYWTAKATGKAYYIPLLHTAIDSRGDLPADVEKFVNLLARYSFLARLLGLGAEEVAKLDQILGRAIDTGFKFTPADVRTILVFKKLDVEYHDTGAGLLNLLPMLAKPHQAAEGLRVKATDFENDQFDEADAQILFSAIEKLNCLDDQGILQELPGVSELSGAIFRASTPRRNLYRELVDHGIVNEETGIPTIRVTESTDLSFLFLRNRDRMSKIEQVRQSLFRAQRLSPFFRDDSFAENGIDRKTSRKILEALSSKKIVWKKPDVHWVVYKGISPGYDLSSDLAFLEGPQIETVKKVLLNSSAIFARNVLVSIGQKDDVADARARNMPLVKALVRTCGWAIDALAYLIREGIFKLEKPVGMREVAVLKCIFDLASSMGVDVKFLHQLSKLHDAPVNGSDQKRADENLQAHRHLAKDLLNVVKSKYDATQWASVYGPMVARLDERERDALVGLLMVQLRQMENVKTNFDGMNTLQDISDYLLLDVEMTGVAKVSKIKQGLNTLQRYIQRCHMGLEGEGGVILPIGDREWSWRSHYRLWEANRKVFLYPENYLDPALRKRKTPEFAELESELLEGEITADSVVKAYNNYFDRVESLARVTIVSSYYTTIDVPREDRAESTLFLVGRSHTSSPVYSFRKVVLVDDRKDSKSDPSIIRWDPWQRIDLAIDAKTVTAIHAFSRLFIFWVETKEETRTVEVDGVSSRIGITKATVKYSFQNISGNWIHPQTLSAIEDKTIHIHPEALKAEIARVDQQLGRIYARLKGETKAITFNFNWTFECPITRNLTAAFIDWDWLLGKTGACEWDEFCDKYVKRFTREADGADKWLRETILELVGNTPVSDGPLRGHQPYGFFKPDFIESVVERTITEKMSAFHECADSMEPLLKKKEDLQKKIDAHPAWQMIVDDDAGWPAHHSYIDWNSVYAINIPQQEGQSERILIIYGDKRAINPDAVKADAGVFPYMAAQLDSDLVDKACQVDFRIDNQSHACWGVMTVPNSRVLSYGKFDSLPVGLFNRNGQLLTTETDALSSPGQTIPVSNQPGWAIFNSGGEQFLLLPHGNQAGKVSENLSVARDDSMYHLNYHCADPIASNRPSRYAFIRLGSTTVDDLSRRIFVGQVDHLLNLEAQHTREKDFSRLRPVDGLVIPPSSDQVDFDGAFGIYFREIFFHIPFLIAHTLNGNQRFEEAQKWYHYIFNPSKPLLNDLSQHLPNRMMGYWPLDEGDGKTAKDRVGSKDGKLEGDAIWNQTSDFPRIPARKVLPFDGRSTYIDLGKQEVLPFGGNKPFSISAWVWPKSKGCIFSKSGSFALGIDKKQRIVLGETIEFFFGDIHVSAGDRRAIPFREWSHIVMAYDGKRSKIYVNGVLDVKFEVALPIHIAGTPVIIGAQSTDDKPKDFFEGFIAEIRMWDVAIDPSAQFWRYRPFRGHTLEKLEDIEGSHPEEFEIYRDDPFDPHAIAGIRLGAYEKAIVMKYIDNLLDWGDQLFAQDSWESIVQAMLLYVLAQDLLGKKPKQTRWTHSPKPILNYDTFPKIDEGTVNFADAFHAADIDYFPVGANANFVDYWDRAEDRLFKIRHCMNIKGIVRQLSLFQPPIDPRQLIQSMAAGRNISSVASALVAPVPHYRFPTMIQQAKNVTSTLTQLGSALLSALEKRDAEQLGLLRSTHEKAILNITTKIQEKQIEDAGRSLDSLQASLGNAKERKLHYQTLIEKGLSRHEKGGISSMTSALEAMEAARGVRGGAVAAHLIPTIFGMSDGGFQPGSSISEAASLSDAFGGIRSHRASMAMTSGQNERRAEEWQLQEALAENDVEQINVQIEGAKIRQEVAQKALDLHRKSIEQADEREALLQGKFTNHDLYQWMVGRISSVYFQTYKIAFDLAQAAEKAYQYERNTDNTLITFGYWDSLKKGLLAGEGLMLGLNQLEKAYFDDNERTLEIEKTISLNQLDVFNGKPEKTTLDGLKKDGQCAFELTERLFDIDFPGHYCRKIKSIAITIPAVVGPYQNVQATLTQTSNRVLLKPDTNGVDYLLNGKSNGAGARDAIRSDWRRQQQIAISKGVNDSGVFELNFRDERYLPFEGTGAISGWTIEMPKANNRIDFESISDVIFHLRYSAEEDGALKTHVRQKAISI